MSKVVLRLVSPHAAGLTDDAAAAICCKFCVTSSHADEMCPCLPSREPPPEYSQLESFPRIGIFSAVS